jgi:hypothetical protein
MAVGVGNGEGVGGAAAEHAASDRAATVVATTEIIRFIELPPNIYGLFDCTMMIRERIFSCDAT